MEKPRPQNSELSKNHAYTPEGAKNSWNRMLAQNINFTDNQTRDTFNRRMFGMTRIKVPFEKSHRSYVGKWKYQDQETTCGVWAFGNAHKVLNTSPNFQLLAELLNYSKGINKHYKKGLPSSVLQDFLQSSTDPKVTFKRPEQTFIGFYPETIEESSINNGVSIKNILDNNSTLYSRVNLEKYTGKREFTNAPGRSHAICISGYHIDSNQEMNVQIVDPMLGVMWASIEHFTYSYLPEETFVISSIS